MTRTIAALLAAAMLVLAGCAAGVPGSGQTDGETTTASGGTGTVNFYVSDQPNAMDDFERLEVTVTKVGFHRVGSDDDAENDSTATPANATDATDTTDDADEARDDEDADEGGEWIVRDVNETTVDLTELRGANATLLDRFDLPNGTYDKVFVYVAEIDGTLKNGEQVNVKLPSERLHVNKRFTVGAGEEVNFVYDATVVKAGKSGKYILKPVVSESGTDVPIQAVDRDDEREGDIGARFVGNVTRGEAATVKVTQNGNPVANATVTVGEETYRTAGDGTVTFDVPGDAEELEVEIEYGDSEAELRRTFPERGDDRGRDDRDGADGRDDEDGADGRDDEDGADGRDDEDDSDRGQGAAEGRNALETASP